MPFCRSGLHISTPHKRAVCLNAFSNRKWRSHRLLAFVVANDALREYSALAIGVKVPVALFLSAFATRLFARVRVVACPANINVSSVFVKSEVGVTSFLAPALGAYFKYQFWHFVASFSIISASLNLSQAAFSRPISSNNSLCRAVSITRYSASGRQSVASLHLSCSVIRSHF